MIIERTTYRPKPGQFEAVLATRRKASRRRREIGLPGGTIFTGESEAGRVVFWECAFADGEAQQRDLAARGADRGFGEIRDAMVRLLESFDRCVLGADEDREASLLVPQDLADHPVAPRTLRFRSGGEELTGYLYLPPGKGPFPCMVTNHGSGVTQGSTEICSPGIAAVLMSAGIASFRPNRRGYGESPGTPWREEVSAEFGTEDYDRQLAARLDRESDDVVAALAAVQGMDEIDPDHIGVMGSSFGGVVTLLSAAKTDGFRCAVDFAGAAMNWDRTPGLRRTMIDAAHRLTVPLFLIQSANDYSIRPTREIAAALEGTGIIVQSRIYGDFGITRDEGHFLFRDGPVLWWPEVRDFLDRWL